VTDFREALQTLRQRVGTSVKEHEVLRISANLGKPNDQGVNDKARREVLSWVAKRAGGPLPKKAWEFTDYEYVIGGRNSSAIRFLNGNADLWAVRAEDPDKSVSGRTWVHEIVVGGGLGGQQKVSVRQLVNSTEDLLQVAPHVPGFVQQLCDTASLHEGGRLVTAEADTLMDEDDAQAFADLLADPVRRHVVLALSEGPTGYLVEPESLQRSVLGLAQVVLVPAEHTWVLTNRFGKMRSVFGGPCGPTFRVSIETPIHILIAS
jgi:hypothetical protein